MITFVTDLTVIIINITVFLIDLIIILVGLTVILTDLTSLIVGEGPQFSAITGQYP
jgi:hypothetical protein